MVTSSDSRKHFYQPKGETYKIIAGRWDTDQSVSQKVNLLWVDGDEGPSSSQTPRGSTGTRKAYPSHDTNVRVFWYKAILAVGTRTLPHTDTEGCVESRKETECVLL